MLNPMLRSTVVNDSTDVGSGEPAAAEGACGIDQLTMRSLSRPLRRALLAMGSLGRGGLAERTTATTKAVANAAVCPARPLSSAAAAASASAGGGGAESGGESGEPSLLSDDEIAARVGALDSVLLPPADAASVNAHTRRPVVSRVFTSSYNANVHNEDTTAVDLTSSLFGVFDGPLFSSLLISHPALLSACHCLPTVRCDVLMLRCCVILRVIPWAGHSGRAASHFCKTKLFSYISDAMHVGQHDVRTALEKAFLTADSDFLNAAFCERRFHDGLSGACAVVCHVSADGVVTAANAGDCRAIVGRRVAACGGGALTRWRSVPLSVDHCVSNPDERDRLLREHPEEPDVLGERSDPRVKGMLQQTRGVGDGMYKQRHYFDLLDRRSMGLSPSAVWRPPYTTARPEVLSHQLTPDDAFMVIATDGLFMDLSSDQVVECLGDFLASSPSFSSLLSPSLSPSPSSPSPSSSTPSSGSVSVSVSGAAASLSPSSFLVKQALLAAVHRALAGRTRAVTPPAGERELMHLVLHVPPGRRRSIHDDVTVTVVLFDPTALPSLAPLSLTSKL